MHEPHRFRSVPPDGRSGGSGRPNPPSRRTLLRSAAAGGLAAAGIVTGAPGAAAATSHVTGSKVRDLSGPALTGRFAAPWTDLGIPVRCPDGSMLFVCGDTFDGGGVGGPDWRSPVALRSSNAAPGSLVVDGAVGGSRAVGLVPEGHTGGTTAIPSDVFTVGPTMYMHLMRGVIYETHHTDFWRSDDNGETWQYLCQWPGGLHGGQFQQKTYAVADDGYLYVLSTAFDREVTSGLLHRVRQAWRSGRLRAVGVRGRGVGLGQPSDDRDVAAALGRDLLPGHGRWIRAHLAQHEPARHPRPDLRDADLEPVHDGGADHDRAHGARPGDR